MRNRAGEHEAAALRPNVVFNDPLPVAHAAVDGLGLALLELPDVLHHLEAGSLIRLLPDWFADLGDMALYHANPPCCR